jgi:hypothetical protein
LAEDSLILTDNYAPAQSLLNPVTQAPYEGGEENLLEGSLHPFIIASVWIAVLVSVYWLYLVLEKRG